MDSLHIHWAGWRYSLEEKEENIRTLNAVMTIIKFEGLF